MVVPTGRTIAQVRPGSLEPIDDDRRRGPAALGQPIDGGCAHVEVQTTFHTRLIDAHDPITVARLVQIAGVVPVASSRRGSLSWCDQHAAFIPHGRHDR